LMKTVWPKALKAAKTWLGRHVTLFGFECKPSGL
jgi:hypothetical protein